MIALRSEQVPVSQKYSKVQIFKSMRGKSATVEPLKAGSMRIKDMGIMQLHTWPTYGLERRLSKKGRGSDRPFWEMREPSVTKPSPHAAPIPF